MCRKPLTAVKGFRQKGGVKKRLVGGKGLEPLTPTLKVSYSTYWVNHPFTFGFVIGIIPHCFSLGALAHIYYSQTDTPCEWEFLSGKSYLLSWASLSFGLLSLSQCLYYNTLWSICQEVFEISFKNFSLVSEGFRNPFGSTVKPFPLPSWHLLL